MNLREEILHEKIKELENISKNFNGLSQRIGNPKNIDILKYLKKETYFLDILNPTIGQRLYYYKNNLSLANCKWCGEVCSIANKLLQNDTCGDNTCIEKQRKKSNKELYGDPNYCNTEKIKSTKEKRYGDPGYVNPQKAKETTLEIYGVEHYSQTEEFKEDFKNTCLDKYGVQHPMQAKRFKDDYKRTCLERYGVENPLQTEDIFFKIQKSGFKAKNYKNTDLYYRGTYELKFLQYCENKKILEKIENGPSIKYIHEEKNKVYFSDFYIKEINLVIEIKSTYYYEKYIDLNISKEKQTRKSGYNYLKVLDNNFKEFNKWL